MKYIGVDIGGMSVKVGLVSDEGSVLYKTKAVTKVNDPDGFTADLVALIEKTLSDNSLAVSDISGIGIGSPGLISSETGVIDRAYNLGLVNYPLVSLLKKRFDTEIKLSNDANVAALGEVVFGAAKGYKDVVMVTLGTGVGGGVIADGKLFEGGYSKGTELGHVTLVCGGETCSCGRKGCLEAYVSASALIRDTRRAMEENPSSTMWQTAGTLDAVDGQTAFLAEKAGDSAAKAVVNTYISYLGEGLLSFMNIFRPQAILIGGGISNEGEAFRARVDEYCKARHYGFEGAPKTDILLAENKNDAGILGAAALVKA